MSVFPSFPQGDIQQLDLVSGPEAAFDHCQTFMPNCDAELPDPSVLTTTHLEYAGGSGDETVYSANDADNYTSDFQNFTSIVSFNFVSYSSKAEQFICSVKLHSYETNTNVTINVQMCNLVMKIIQCMLLPNINLRITMPPLCLSTFLLAF